MLWYNHLTRQGSDGTTWLLPHPCEHSTSGTQSYRVTEGVPLQIEDKLLRPLALLSAMKLHGKGGSEYAEVNRISRMLVHSFGNVAARYRKVEILSEVVKIG